MYLRVDPCRRDRNVFERNLGAHEAGAVKGQLIEMCHAYLKAVRATGQ